MKRDALFMALDGSRVPTGSVTGTVLVRGLAWLIYLVAWQGKIFDPDRPRVWNRVSPFGVQAFTAKTYPGISRLDQRPCLVLDYGPWLRDEIRPMSSKTYLGRLYVGGWPILYFTLTQD